MEISNVGSIKDIRLEYKDVKYFMNKTEKYFEKFYEYKLKELKNYGDEVYFQLKLKGSSKSKSLYFTFYLKDTSLSIQMNRNLYPLNTSIKGYNDEFIKSLCHIIHFNIKRGDNE